MQIAFSANAASRSGCCPRQPGISPMKPAAPGGLITDRSGR
jgi:hypothetical protein